MIERCRWAWVALALFAGACSENLAPEPNAPKGPEFVPTVGGQSGSEGACADLGIKELPFDPEEVFARALGRHTTRSVWNDGSGKPQSATFEIKDRRKVEVDSECGPRSAHDVSVHMEVPSAGVNVEFEAMAAVDLGQRVTVWTQLDGDYKSTLSEKAWDFDDTVPPTPAATKFYFDLWWYDGEITGQLGVSRGKGESYESCWMAIWPNSYCGNARVPFPQDKRIDGFDAEMALDMVRGLGDQLLTFEDGTTTHVQFEVEPAAGPLCVGPYSLHYGEGHLLGAIEVEVPVTVHVTTSDGRVAARIPGSVTPVILPSTGMQNMFSVQGGFSGPRSAVEAAGVRLFSDSDANTLSFSFSVTRDMKSTWGTLAAWEYDLAMAPSELVTNWRERPIGVCSKAEVGVGASVQGQFIVMQP